MYQCQQPKSEKKKKKRERERERSLINLVHSTCSYESYLLSNKFLKVLNYFESPCILCGLICLRMHYVTVRSKCMCFVQAR